MMATCTSENTTAAGRCTSMRRHAPGPVILQRDSNQPTASASAPITSALLNSHV